MPTLKEGDGNRRYVEFSSRERMAAAPTAAAILPRFTTAENEREETWDIFPLFSSRSSAWTLQDFFSKVDSWMYFNAQRDGLDEQVKLLGWKNPLCCSSQEEEECSIRLRRSNWTPRYAQ